LREITRRASAARGVCIPKAKGAPPPSGSPQRGTEPDRAADAIEAARRASNTDQELADADQSASDADQGASDTDQTAADRDQTGSDRDQLAADEDQAAADEDRAAHADISSAVAKTYDNTREHRQHAALDRLSSRLERQSTARDRDVAATGRDQAADARDTSGRSRDSNAKDLVVRSSARKTDLLRQLEEVRAQAAADRARAAVDRARAAVDRQRAAAERARLEAELLAAHLDELTGVYRRDMGRLAITHEIGRARRSNAPFVLAFVDVDELKTINDRDGHAAGDRVLQAVARAMQARLRSFDPIMRYGGDEFVCGLGSADLAEAERRFLEIRSAIVEEAGVDISVGFAQLEPGETEEALTGRADEAMRRVKAEHYAANHRASPPRQSFPA
jgi:diguanylate cyclase (GGDEF)-like protein